MKLYPFCIFSLMALSTQSVTTARFPNDVIETPIVTCEPDKITIKIQTTSSNPSIIYADNFYEDHECATRNMNYLSIEHGKCGMTSENMSSPNGVLQRICVSVQMHPLFVTEADKYYCAQCVYMESNVVNDLEQTLSVSEAAPSELEPMFDEMSAPKCSYSIRRGSKDGPEIHFTTIGEIAYHVWTCNNENVGILVQNCYVVDVHGNSILIIDQNGCGIDQYVLPTPEYTADLKTAYQKTHVFKFAENTLTKFTCQIRLCLKNHKGNGCKNITPPALCPTLEEREQGIFVHKNDTSNGNKNGNNKKSTTSLGVNGGFFSSGYGNDKPSAPVSSYTDNAAVSESPMVTRMPGYNRQRRAITLNGNGTKPIDLSNKAFHIFKNQNGEYPELDVVGSFRVVDSAEEASILEAKLNGTLISNSNSLFVRNIPPVNCMSEVNYWGLILVITILAVIQIITFTYFISKRLFPRVMSQNLKMNC
uniref:ZP domain-containing protein n=1 Tax=Rhabditophanes sp. KR3021 TaxID=114890 RepID=A0AC35THY0_9BILA